MDQLVDDLIGLDLGGGTHPTFSCELCGIERIVNQANLDAHLQGRRHRAATRAAAVAAGAPAEHSCQLCELSCNSALSLATHLAGRRHRAAAAAQPGAAQAEAPLAAAAAAPPGVAAADAPPAGARQSRRNRRRRRRQAEPLPFRCELCECGFRSQEELGEHEATSRWHAANYRRAHVAEFAATAEAALGDLPTLNAWLAGLDLPVAETVGEARRELKKVLINIYDLVEERYEPVFDSVRELAAYTFQEEKIFPLTQAKGGGQLKLFLRGLFRSGGMRRRSA